MSFHPMSDQEIKGPFAPSDFRVTPRTQDQNQDCRELVRKGESSSQRETGHPDTGTTLDCRPPCSVSNLGSSGGRDPFSRCTGGVGRWGR